MSRVRRTAEDWRRVVFRARWVVTPDGQEHKVRAETSLTLLYLADFMTIDRQVSRGRHLIARDLGMSEASVKRRVAEAHTLGFLSTVRRGQKGITAEYQGLFPKVTAGRSAGQHVDPQRTPDSDPLKPRSVGQHVDPPIDTHRAPQLAGCETCADDGCSNCEGWGGLPLAAPTATSGIDEEAEDQPARGSVTECQWHDETHPCPECANHQARRRTA